MGIKPSPPPPELSQEELRSLVEDVSGYGDVCFERFMEMIEDGVYPRLAASLSTQCFSNIGTTNATFNRREHRRMSTMDDRNREVVTAIARKAGINTTGKTYNGALGRYSDPRAWVSDTSDVVSAANAKGLSIRGMVNVENEQRPMTKTKMAKDLVDRFEAQYRASNPALNEQVSKNKSKRQELREGIVEKHSLK